MKFLENNSYRHPRHFIKMNNSFSLNFEEKDCPICKFQKPKETFIVTGYNVKTNEPIQWKIGRTLYSKIINISKTKKSFIQIIINKILKLFGLKTEKYFKIIYDKNTYQFNVEEIKNADI